MSRTPYETLGVTAQATQDEIKNAYRDLAKKLHPDLHPGEKTETRFKEINAAYETIGTPKERQKYDESMTAAPPPPDASSFAFENVDDDFLQSFLGRMGNRTARGARRTRDDTRYQMEISFKDAVLGKETEITLATGRRLAVKIPAGVESGTRLRFVGHGSPGATQPGDAYVELHVIPSPIFERKDRDLEIELPVSLSEALLGAQVTVPTIDGSVELKIPPGVRPGQRLRVTGKGVPGGTTQKRGDQYVRLRIEMPPSLDAEMKSAVESWSQRLPYDARRNWIGKVV